jgi:hypothetical protein
MQLEAAEGYAERGSDLANDCIDRAKTLARQGLRDARR